MRKQVQDYSEGNPNIYELYSFVFFVGFMGISFKAQDILCGLYMTGRGKPQKCHHYHNVLSSIVTL